MLEPPAPRLHPLNLVNYNNDGPAVYNLKFPFPASARLVVRFREESARSALRRGAPTPLLERPHGTQSHFPPSFPRVPPTPGHVDGFSQFASAVHAPTLPPPGSPAAGRPLPRCDAGDAPGAWLVHTSMYPDHPGEPWQWRPFECAWPRVSGRQMRECLDHTALGGVHFYAESTGVQARVSHTLERRLDCTSHFIFFFFFNV